MDSSDSDAETSLLMKNRLGKCEVCNHEIAIYSCPKCEVKTCCIKCLNIHKKELECSGLRDKTKFVPLKSMTEMDFMSDYSFLEECTRYVSDRKRDKFKGYTRYNKRLPAKLFKLRQAAKERGTTLRFLLQHFSRSISNSTTYDVKEKAIYWRIQWVFPNAENFQIADEKCCENETLIDLAKKYMMPSLELSNENNKKLVYYHSRGISGVTFLLKAEGIMNCRNRFFELDVNKSLKENLKDKTLIEFPAIYIVFTDVVKELFYVIDYDEDIELETATYLKELELQYGRNVHSTVPPSSSTKDDEFVVKSEEEIRATMERLEIEKKREARRIKREEIKKEPQNYLFPDERLWDELSSNSDSGDETEEEKDREPVPMKKIKVEEPVPAKKIKVEDDNMGL